MRAARALERSPRTRDPAPHARRHGRAHARAARRARRRGAARPGWCGRRRGRGTRRRRAGARDARRRADARARQPGREPRRPLEARRRTARRRAVRAGNRRRGESDSTARRSKSGACSCAAALTGLAWRALEIAAAYATERRQFDRPIGAFQGIAHPLADAATDVEGARLLTWYTVWSIARETEAAASLVPLCLAWAARSATRAVARALHTHGGYGLSLEYDIQLYHRRGKAWALAAGDPRDLFVLGAERRWDGAAGVALPAAGDPHIEFAFSAEAEAVRPVARRFFEENLTPEVRARMHFSWDGHDPVMQRKLAEAGLLFPTWPREYGGLEADPWQASVIREEFVRAGWTQHATGTTGLVADTVLAFGSEELKREVLPRIARGEATCALGYSEPGSGSDVAAAQTRAVRDGDHWVIDGQKMFTSGAHLAEYVFLLTRTDRRRRQAQGTDHVPRAARHARDRGPADRDALGRAHQRDLLRGRARTGPLSRRPGQRRMVGAPSRPRHGARRRVGRDRRRAPQARGGRGRLGAAQRPLGRPAHARAPRLRRRARRGQPRAGPLELLEPGHAPPAARRGRDEQAVHGRGLDRGRRRHDGPVRPRFDPEDGRRSAPPATARSSSPIATPPRSRSTAARARSCAASSRRRRWACRAAGASRL